MRQATLRFMLTLSTLLLLSLPAQAALEDDTLCVETGGSWTSCGSGCGPFTCDYLPPSLGGEPMLCPSVCDSHCLCPETAPLWDEAAGCVALEACEKEPDDVALCTATGGEWIDCGSGCGPATCYAPPPSPGDEPPVCPSICLEQCGCPAEAPMWDPTAGCVAADACPPDSAAAQQVLCAITGGGWTSCGSGCGPMGCEDDPADFLICDAACVALCACPETAPYWDDAQGCMTADECGADPLAIPKALCAAGGGEWTDCGCPAHTCENPPPGPDDEEVPCPPACWERCDCPDGMLYWDDAIGCHDGAMCLDNNPTPDVDGDGYTADVDCDDGDAAVHPGALEVCNGTDDDCDGLLDEDVCDDLNPCDDGSTDLCDMEPPTCDDGFIVAVQDGCFVCVDPVTCEPADAGDPMPPGMALCEAAGGTWAWCGSGCGPYTCDNLPPGEDDEPVDCPAVCVEQCACPADAPLWDEQEGCIPQSACGTDSPQETLCKETGGAWDECGSMCPVNCDTPVRDPNMACDDGCLEQCACPDDAPLWHDTLGCVALESCGYDEVDGDMDGYPEGTDCDDANAGIYPGATEVCNGADDDCDGEVDEGCALQADKNLCVQTGGAWNDCGSGCGAYTCDHLPPAPGEAESCLAVCVAMCDCPADTPLWDAVEGCVPETVCDEPDTDPEPDPGETPGEGEGDSGGGDSGGCAGGGGPPSALWWGLFAMAWMTRRRLARQG